MCSTGAAVTRTDADSLMAEASREDGWYLYGITQPISGERAPARSDATGVKVDETHLDLGPDHEPVHVLAIGSLAAVVRRVPLADFTAEALEARIGDPAWLTLAVQMHNDIIRAVHQERAILPAKFGLSMRTLTISRRPSTSAPRRSWHSSNGSTVAMSGLSTSSSIRRSSGRPCVPTRRWIPCSSSSLPPVQVERTSSAASSTMTSPRRPRRSPKRSP